VPILVRSLRVGMLEVLESDFVAAARAKGLSESRVLFVHVTRNAIIPTLTLLGLNIAFLVGSTVIVEQVFALNGLGALLLSSITNRDYPVVQGLTVVLATSVVLINLATDLASSRLDPRIRLR
jgi:peptide/nickel transport system permease protein